jgi:pimeloyl-ACP methyl ester carboxylesterase
MYPAGVPGVAARMLPIPGGLRLRVVESGPASGEPVLLVHGWGASVYTYRHLLPAIAHTGRRAIAFDLRGHGLSDKPEATADYTTAALLGDLHALMDAMELARADVIGHSLGGSLALRLALESPDRVRKLVLADPVGLSNIPLRRIAHRLTPRVLNKFARYLVPRWVTSFLVHGAYGNPLRVPAEAIDEYWAPTQFPGYYRAVRGLLDVFSWEPLPPERLASVRAPILLGLGTADRLIPRTKESAAKIPNATVVLLKGGGHLAIEECATEINAAIVGFLTGSEPVATSPTRS